RRPNGDVAIIDNGIFIIGPRGDTIASLPPVSSSYGTIHHAITNSPSGGVLFVATDKRTIADTVVTGDGIFEWDPASNVVVKRWTAFDFFDWKTQRTSQSAVSNWLHANALNVGPRGNYILSMRNMNQVASVAPDFKSVEWRLGGPGATITLPVTDLFYGQHGAREIADGRLLVFDNGFERPSGGSFSRAMEIAIDTNARTGTKKWEYRETPDNLAVRLGSVHRFSNGNTFITFGWLSPSPIQIVEVTGAGQKVFTIAPAGTVIEKIYASEPVTSLFGERDN
ncbi:MAG: aryl-sulfate sulfotransferase, partial [Longimicrobiales bacterium]